MFWYLELVYWLARILASRAASRSRIDIRLEELELERTDLDGVETREELDPCLSCALSLMSSELSEAIVASISLIRALILVLLEVLVVLEVLVEVLVVLEVVVVELDSSPILSSRYFLFSILSRFRLAIVDESLGMALIVLKLLASPVPRKSPSLRKLPRT